ncbi:hypothetical protein J6590_015761 [Homalodisca vitripennis]|nr:hypothetical protein J6590_015761 [Homalodisca vitripennis]
MQENAELAIPILKVKLEQRSPFFNLNWGLTEDDHQWPGRRLLARTGSLSGHPPKQQPRSTLLD